MTKKTTRRVRRQPSPQAKSTISPLLIGIVVIAALLIVGGLILLGNQTSSSQVSGPVDVSQFPALGDREAPVTMIEFSDYG